MEIRSKLWIEIDDEPVFGKGRRDLLAAIDRYGSINQAAKSINISYRKAWGYISSMEERLGIKLINRQVGGCHGGGSVLTETAREFLNSYSLFEEGINEAIDERFRQIFHIH